MPSTRPRFPLFSFMLVLLFGLALLASAASGGARVSPASATATCYTEGIVVAALYASSSPALPQSSDSSHCWTTDRPASNHNAYTNCNSLKTPHLIPGGSLWNYDDTNPGRSPSDGTVNAACNNHLAYTFEWMSRANGYTWDFSPTYLMEEDYTSASHTNLAYSGTRHAGNWAHTNSSFASIPSFDMVGSNVASSIRANCHRVVIYSGTPSEYMIGLYNDRDAGAQMSSIISALNACYPG